MRKALAIVVLMACTYGTSQAQTKRALTVQDFEWGTVQTTVQAVFGTNVDIGKGINALMTRRISQDGKFTVVERRNVNALLKEQDFDKSNRVKQGTGARIGQVRGAELTLMGDIVVFGRDDRRKSAGGLVIVPGGGGGGVGTQNTAKAVVVFEYRLVDTETSEVVAAGEARGESKRVSRGGLGGMFAGGVLVAGGFSSNANNFAETIIGEAVMDACDKLAQDLNQRATNVASSARDIEVDARVADVSGEIVTINAGAQSGIQTGSRLTVYRKGKEIKDPVTNEVLDVQVTPIGTIVITNVRDRVASGTYAGNPAQIGDVVRSK